MKSQTSGGFPSPSRERTDIYYWKCDRAAAFHGIEAVRPDSPLMESQLRHALEKRFPDTPITLRPANGQGNHRTFRLTLGAWEAFVRTEDGPEHDNYFAAESLIITELHARGLPVPRCLAYDCDRTDTPFAWQVLEFIPWSDLNQSNKDGTLSVEEFAPSIGEAVARWQYLRPQGFGPFSASEARDRRSLIGLHENYEHYYMLNLMKHLDFLVAHSFFTDTQAATVLGAIESHRDLLDIPRGCLVHKDLALWNILGSPLGIVAFIDWDDAISGDPMDDLSLLGCFHDATVLERAMAGYARVRPLPENHVPRFWLHLLRNMLVKAVIRVGGGYFHRTDSFFLIGSGATGADLEAGTYSRIETALRGLREKRDISIL